MPRPVAPLLSSQRIKSEALRIIDADGLEGLTMRKLAAALDVQAASLYGHVANKEELLHALVNDLAEEVDVSCFEHGWYSGLRSWAGAYRDLLAVHPNLVPFLAQGPAQRPGSLRQADAIHGALLRAGWPARYATMIGAAVTYLVLGAAVTQYGGGFSRGFSDNAQVYLDRYPNLYEAHRLRSHGAALDNDAFDLALTATLNGFRAMYSTVAKVDQSTVDDAEKSSNTDR